MAWIKAKHRAHQRVWVQRRCSQLDKNATEGILVGYSDRSKEHRMTFPKTDKAVISSRGYFDKAPGLYLMQPTEVREKLLTREQETARPREVEVEFSRVSSRAIATGGRMGQCPSVTCLHPP